MVNLEASLSIVNGGGWLILETSILTLFRYSCNDRQLVRTFFIITRFFKPWLVYEVFFRWHKWLKKDVLKIVSK